MSRKNSSDFTHISISKHNAIQHCETFDISLYRQGNGIQHLALSGISFERVQRILNAYPNIELYDRISREIARRFTFGTPVFFKGAFGFKVEKAVESVLYAPYELDEKGEIVFTTPKNDRYARPKK